MTDPKFVPDACANCFTPLPADVNGLFCTPLCRDIASLVRYWRGIERDGRINDPDVQYALSTKVAHVLGGGYDANARHLPDAVRKAVIARDGGRCVQCGRPGEEIDHIRDSSPDLENLQLLCRECHHAKTAESLVPASDEKRAWITELERARVQPPMPVQLSDSVEWGGRWRTLTAERKKRLAASGAGGVSRTAAAQSAGKDEQLC